MKCSMQCWRVELTVPVAAKSESARRRLSCISPHCDERRFKQISIACKSFSFCSHVCVGILLQSFHVHIDKDSNAAGKLFSTPNTTEPEAAMVQWVVACPSSNRNVEIPVWGSRARTTLKIDEEQRLRSGLKLMYGPCAYHSRCL